MIKEIRGRHFVNVGRLDDDSIIVDAGAGWGVTIEDLRTYRQTKKCRIFAIECNRDHIKTLKKKNFPNVIIYEKALVGQNSLDKATFYQHLGLPGWGNIIRTHGEGHGRFKGIKTYEVETLGVNDIFRELELNKIDFLKMDIEGSEKEVLKTMSKETASKIGQLSVEFHSSLGAPREYIEHRLKELGFGIKAKKKTEIFCER